MRYRFSVLGEQPLSEIAESGTAKARQRCARRRATVYIAAVGALESVFLAGFCGDENEKLALCGACPEAERVGAGEIAGELFALLFIKHTGNLLQAAT